MAQKARLLAPIFAVAAIIVVVSPVRTLANEAAKFMTTSDEILTSEFSATTKKQRQVARRRTVGANKAAKVSTHSHKTSKAGSGGHKSTKLGNTNVNNGRGKMSSGPGKLTDSPGKLGAGPAAGKPGQFLDEGPAVSVEIPPLPGDVVKNVKTKATLWAAYLDCMTRAIPNSSALQTAIKAAQSVVTAAQASANQANEQFHLVSVAADPCWNAVEAASAASAGRDCTALKAQYSPLRDNAVKQNANLSNAQTQLARAQQAYDSLNSQAHALCDQILN